MKKLCAILLALLLTATLVPAVAEDTGLTVTG